MSFFFQASPAHQFVKSPAWQRVNGSSPMIVQAISCGGSKFIGGFRPIVIAEPSTSFENQPIWLATQLANLSRYKINTLSASAVPEWFADWLDGQIFFLFHPPNQSSETRITDYNVFSTTATPDSQPGAPVHPDSPYIFLQPLVPTTDTKTNTERLIIIDDNAGDVFTLSITLSDPLDGTPLYVTARDRFLALPFDAEPDVPNGPPANWLHPNFALAFREWQYVEYGAIDDILIEPTQHLYPPPWDGSNVVVLNTNPNAPNYSAIAWSGWAAIADKCKITVNFWRSKLRFFGPPTAPYWVIRVETGAGWGTVNGIGFGQHIYRTTLIQQGTIASGQTIARGTNPELPFPTTSYFDADIMHAGFLKTSDLYFAGIGNTPQDFLTANNLSYGLKIKA